jgi:hypothetical protein
MGVLLMDLSDETRFRNCNWWNWRPSMELIATSKLIPEDRLELMGYNAGAEVTQAEARAIAAYLESSVLPLLHGDQRVLQGGSLTTELDDGTFYREPSELHRNYSTSADWLGEFAQFCRECDGFAVW